MFEIHNFFSWLVMKYRQVLKINFQNVSIITNIFCYTNNSTINRPLILCNDTVAPKAVYCVQDRDF